jgi:hypothetical protein
MLDRGIRCIFKKPVYFNSPDGLDQALHGPSIVRREEDIDPLNGVRRSGVTDRRASPRRVRLGEAGSQ